MSSVFTACVENDEDGYFKQACPCLGDRGCNLESQTIDNEGDNKELEGVPENWRIVSPNCKLLQIQLTDNIMNPLRIHIP